MKLERSLFLTWLLYAVVVAFMSITGMQLGYFGIVITNDPTFISIAIIGAYLISEAFIAWNIWKVDTELEKTKKIAETIGDTFEIDDLPDGVLKEYVIDFSKKSTARKENHDHNILLDAFADRLYAKNYGAFMGDLVVRLGLLGTIVGLILAFMPFIDQSFAGGAFATDQIQSIITSLFKGISAAFFTTAAGIICGTLLTISGRIYEAGSDKLIDNIVLITETKIIPKLGK